MDARRMWPLSALVGGAVLAVVLLPGKEISEPAPPPTRGEIELCVDDTHDGCSTDVENRRRLTADQRAEIARALVVLPPLSRTEECGGASGACTVTVAPIDEAYVATARSALVAEGHRDAVLRLARPTDRAPEGSLVYGIPVGAGCVIGFRSQDATIRHEVGRLPDGGCLAK